MKSLLIVNICIYCIFCIFLTRQIASISQSFRAYLAQGVGVGGSEIVNLTPCLVQRVLILNMGPRLKNVNYLLTPYTVDFTTKQLSKLNSWSILCCRCGSTMFLIPVWLKTKGVKTGFPGTKINLDFLEVVHNSFMGQMNTWIISLRLINGQLLLI